MAAEEQERNEAEEAEKRLKAALTAKREPSANSRLASPSLGASASTPETTDKRPTMNEPTPMEGIAPTDTDVAKREVSRAPEVFCLGLFDATHLTHEQSPWLPELARHFEDLKKVAPGNACDVIG